MSPKPSSRKEIKRLFWDIETSPNVGFFWRAGFDQDISHDNIIHERKIICIGYMWEGESVATVLRWDNKQEDRAMLEKFMKVANEADELVAHYGDRFDLPWFRTRCMILGLEPLAPCKTIDTKAWASKNFYFNSNKLDYLGSVLGFGNKHHTEFGLWKDIVLKNCKKSLDYMCRYCGRDVELLAKVYAKLALHVAPKSHAGVFKGHEKWTCPRTGSMAVRKSKTLVSASGTVTHQMQSLADGSYFRISETAYAAYLKHKKNK